jgi:hypothetical protein
MYNRYFYFEVLSLKDYCSLLYFYIQLTRIFWGYSFFRIGMCTLVDLNYRDILRPYEIGIGAYSKVNIKCFNPLTFDSITKIALF